MAFCDEVRKDRMRNPAMSNDAIRMIRQNISVGMTTDIFEEIGFSEDTRQFQRIMSSQSFRGNDFRYGKPGF